MTNDKALEAALLPCPFCGSQAFSREDHNHSTGWEIDCGQDSEHRCEIRPSVWARNKAEAIAAWNRRAPLEASPLESADYGEFTPITVGSGATGAWEGYWLGSGSVNSGTRVTNDRRTAEAWGSDGAEVTTLASLQAMQARAEKAEARAHTASLGWADALNDLEAAEQRGLEKAAEVADADDGKALGGFGNPDFGPNVARRIAAAIRSLGENK